MRRKVDQHLIKKHKPEVIFVATGSKPHFPPDMKGTSLSHVYTVEQNTA